MQANTFDDVKYVDATQLSIMNETMDRFFSKPGRVVGCGLQIPMGGGKTRMSIFIALKFPGVSLVVCSKSLVGGWIDEIESINDIIEETNKTKKEKHKYIRYYVAHSDYDKKYALTCDPTKYDFVITTPEALKSEYTKNDLNSWLISKHLVKNKFNNLSNETLFYNKFPKVISGVGLFYCTSWNFTIVDEFHQYMNINTQAAKALICIPSQRKLALSGTLFADPKPEKLITYMLFIEHKDWPNSVPETSAIAFKRSNFEGTNKYVVHRTEKQMDINIAYTKHIVVVKMSEIEKSIYSVFKEITLQAIARFKRSKIVEDEDGRTRKSLNSDVLSMITYLRQCLIAPFLLRSTLGLSNSVENFKETEIKLLIKKELKTHKLTNYFNTKKSVLSARLEKIIEIINNPINSKIVVFSCYRKTLDLLQQLITDRNVQTISSETEDRAQVIRDLSKSESFVLLLTYALGSDGLNLQFANSVLCIDYDFTATNTDQSLKRVVRRGQKQKVNVYFVCSDTYLESTILRKHVDKKLRGLELENGNITTEVEKLKFTELCKFIETVSMKESMVKANIENIGNLVYSGV